MPDPQSLTAFGNFMAGLLPRLLLYPGGLFAVALAAALGFALPRLDGARGIRDGGWEIGEGEAGGEAEKISGLAIAWAGVALLPLPGASVLPGAPDLLTPLGLLLSAVLILRAGGSVPAWLNREAWGRPLLMAAPLVALAALGGEGLLLPIQTSAGFMAGAARVFAGLAYVVGFCRCYALPSTAPWTTDGSLVGRAAAWMEWLGWLGLGMTLLPVAWTAEGGNSWSGALLTALAAAVAGCALTTGLARAVARMPVWGWAAIGLALCGTLFG